MAAERKDDPQEMAEMRAWLKQVCEELGLDPDLIGFLETPLLDLIRTVAHNRSRPGAPLTAFFIGLAAGQQQENPRELVDKLSALALEK